MSFRTQPVRHLRQEQGSAAIELALILPILVILLTFPIFLAKCQWHYTATQKAAQDAARFLANLPRQAMRSRALSEEYAGIAANIARAELAELDPGHYPPSVEVYCGNAACTGIGARPLPTTVRVLIKTDMFDTIFGVTDVGQFGLAITAEVVMPYTGL
jgi:Flp pilus assembly pilin Flp